MIAAHLAPSIQETLKSVAAPGSFHLHQMITTGFQLEVKLAALTVNVLMTPSVVSVSIRATLNFLWRLVVATLGIGQQTKSVAFSHLGVLPSIVQRTWICMDVQVVCHHATKTLRLHHAVVAQIGGKKVFRCPHHLTPKSVKTVIRHGQTTWSRLWSGWRVAVQVRTLTPTTTWAQHSPAGTW